MKQTFTSLAVGLLTACIVMMAQHAVILTMRQTDLLSPTILLSRLLMQQQETHVVDRRIDLSYNPYNDPTIPYEFADVVSETMIARYTNNKQQAELVVSQIIANHQYRDVIRRSSPTVMAAVAAIWNLIDPVNAGTNVVTGGINFVEWEKRQVIADYIDDQYHLSCNVVRRRPSEWCFKIGNGK